MNFAKKIQTSRFWKYTLAAQKAVIVLSTLCVVITLGAVIVCRYVLHYNFLGYIEIIVTAAIWMYFIGASYASWDECHINADIVSQFVSDRTKIILEIISKTFQVLIGIPMTYLAYEMLTFDFQTNPVTVDLQIPLAFHHIAILISFALMAFYSAVYILRDVDRLKNLKNN
ncbi:MAG: TRAP transporter small permease [Synergistaceae bacterium]|nr:TRAP transporter small permease [Synergistaceae bacterium]